MNEAKRQYHIRVAPGEIGKYVLMPGDPSRCERVAKYLDNPQKIAEHREHRTYTGTYKGVTISVTSTGMGTGSTAIAAEELINVGAECLIRIGSTGAIDRSMKIGDLFISIGTMREEGTTPFYYPLSFPSIPDFDFTRNLVATAEELSTDMNFKLHTGVNVTCDAFYCEGAEWTKKMQELGVKCVEMESAAIYAVCHKRKKRGAMISAVSSEIYKQIDDQGEDDGDSNTYDYLLDNPGLREGWDKEIKVVLEAIYRFETRQNKG